MMATSSFRKPFHGGTNGLVKSTESERVFKEPYKKIVTHFPGPGKQNNLKTSNFQVLI
jgi:hypothetical protein